MVGINPTAEQLSQLQAFEDALYEANAVMNMTRIPQEDCYIKHFLDSLLFQDMIPQGAELLDVGAGPGFPSFPLACLRPDLFVTAMDSSGKMTRFLEKQVLPNLKVVNDRIEDSGASEEFDVVTGRAVAPLNIQMEISAQSTKIGGVVIPMRSANEEYTLHCLDFLGLELMRVERRPLPETDIIRAFPVYQKKGKTPKSYPRRWGEIKAKPLN